MPVVEGVLLAIGFVLNSMDRGLNFCQWVVYHLLVCLRNSRRLLSMLLHGTQTWVFMLGRLLLFTLLLIPGWYHLLRYWFFCPFILRNVEYGRGARHRHLMDIYLPLSLSPQERSQNDIRVYPRGAPVVVFVSGGAWLIGYKLWSALVGRGLSTLGLLVVVPDYRNFPQGDVRDMMEDVTLAVQWTREHAHRFGGDREKIVLAGQSAGAHICLCALVEDFLREKEREREGERAGCEAQCERVCERREMRDDGCVSHNTHTQHGLSHTPSYTQSHTKPHTELESERGATTAASSPSPHTFDAWVSPLSHNSPDAVRRRRSHTDTPSHSVSHTSHTTHSPLIPLNSLIQHTSHTHPSTHTPHNALTQQHIPHSSHTHHTVDTHTHTRSPSPSLLRERDRARISYDDLRALCESDSLSERVVYPSSERDSERDTHTNTHTDTHTLSPAEEEEDVSGVWRVVCVGGPAESESEWDSVCGSVCDAHACLSEFGDSEDACSPLQRLRPLSQSHTPHSTTPHNVVYVRDSPSHNMTHTTHNTTYNTHTEKAHNAVSQFSLCDSVRLFIGVSGPYDLHALVSHLHERGLDSTILNWIACQDLCRFSPTLQLQRFADAHTQSQRERARRAARARKTRRSLPHTTLSHNNDERMTQEGLTTHGSQRNSAAKDPLGVVQGAGVVWWRCVWDLLALLFTEREDEGERMLYEHRRGSVSDSEREDERERESDSERDSASVCVLCERDVCGERDHVCEPCVCNHCVHMRERAVPHNALRDFPPTAIFHGSADKTIPQSISTALAEALHTYGVRTHTHIYDGWSHTDAILEAPLAGNTRLFRDMLRLVYRYTDSEEQPHTHAPTADKEKNEKVPLKDPLEDPLKELPIETSLVPPVLMHFARAVNPF